MISIDDLLIDLGGLAALTCPVRAEVSRPSTTPAYQRRFDPRNRRTLAASAGYTHDGRAGPYLQDEPDLRRVKPGMRSSQRRNVRRRFKTR